ncbi:MAG: DNA gyrase inhibitor YacG [Gammaproteobacteria bacterium]|nr:DNA gyrase inhibitor YacG [Gammaproteobacteria bacterium]
MKKPRLIACPTCQKVVEWSEQNPWRPFCSERCRLIDLGEWASGGHRIPGEPQPPVQEDEDNS